MEVKMMKSKKVALNEKKGFFVLWFVFFFFFSCKVLSSFQILVE